MENTKVLFISQEITPYLPESEMSVLVRNLPQGIQEKGREIRTFMPKFGCINERRNQLHEVIRLSGMNLIINDTDHPLIIKVASIQSARMQVYFIDNEDYFSRKATLHDTGGKYFEDNDERAIFFARGVLETVKKLQWAPDIIHCHGWFTGLVPLFLKYYYNDDPMFMQSKTIFSFYNNEFPKPLNNGLKKKLLAEGLPESELQVINSPSYENMCKLAINLSDGVIYGSEKIHPAVKKYVEQVDKPLLSYYPDEDYINVYSEFYDNILTMVS